MPGQPEALTIKLLPLQEPSYPRAVRRLRELGVRALDDAELLTCLLGPGNERDRLEAMLMATGGLKVLSLEEFGALGARPEFGARRATALLAAVELGRRAIRAEEKRPVLNSAQEVFEYLLPRLGALRHEVFHVLCFNSRQVLLRDVRIAEGTTDACPVDPREIFSPALQVCASGHPLGPQSSIGERGAIPPGHRSHAAPRPGSQAPWNQAARSSDSRRRYVRVDEPPPPPCAKRVVPACTAENAVLPGPASA